MSVTTLNVQGKIMLNCVTDISMTFASEQFQRKYWRTLLCWRKSSIWRHRETKVCDTNSKKCDCSERGICKLTLSRTWSILLCVVYQAFALLQQMAEILHHKIYFEYFLETFLPPKTMVVFLCLRLYRSQYFVQLKPHGRSLGLLPCRG